RQTFGHNPARTFGIGDSEPDREIERAADTGLTFQPDAPAHQLDQAATDGQAKPRAAMLARGGHVGLGEGLKELGRLLGCHPDPSVADGKLELNLLAGAFNHSDIEPDLTVLGELHRVVYEVRQNLAESQWIAQKMLRRAGSDVGQEFESFLVRLLCGQ